MKYRLAAIDLDGTLLAGPGPISQANAAALRALAEAGVHIAPATARGYQHAIRPFALAGLTVPAIVSAGADIRHATGDPISQHPLPRAFADFFLDLADRAGWKVTLATPHGGYQREDPLPEWAANPPPYLRPVTAFAGHTIEEILSALVWSGQPTPHSRELEAWRGRINLHHALTLDGQPLLTATAPGIDKGSGLAALCAELGIAPEEAVVFGDSDVDLPMFEIAGLAVAMGNAEPGVKDRAGFHAPHAAEDGVAAAIRQIWGL